MLTNMQTKAEANTMNDASLPCTVALQRPLIERWAHDLHDFALGSLRRAAAAWRRAAERREWESRVDAAADMSEALLQDIGAPDWLLAEAAGRREANAQRLNELMRGASYRAVDERQW
jgi:hypothetical protein